MFEPRSTTFWDELEAAAGHTTPRITVAQSLDHDSMPPPATANHGRPSSLLTEMDATERVPGAPLYPELTLGLALPKPAASGDKPPVSARARGEGPLGDDHDDGLHISVMRGDAHEQLKSAGQTRSSPRAPTPQLAVSSRVARASNVRFRPSEAPTMDTVLTRMMPALRLIGAGVAIMIADVLYATLHGSAFRLGPARALWIAGPLVGYGVVKLVLSLSTEPDR